MNTETRFPSIHASAAFTDSAVVHANQVGVNPIELDALSQVISRLSRDESTVAPSSMERELRADSTPFGHSAHADPDTCSTLIRTGS
ncbi:hypothetical protein ACT01K_08975, partial [Pseudomonas aeruginosa]